MLTNVREGIRFEFGNATGVVRECVIHGRFNTVGTGLLVPPGVSTAPADSTQPMPTEVAGFHTGVTTWEGALLQNILARDSYQGFFISNVTARYCTSVRNTLGFHFPTQVASQVFDSIVASNTAYGMMLTYCNQAVTTDYVDVWPGGIDESCFNDGPNIAAFDPFFVNPSTNDFRLASNSIFKNFSSSGGEIGAYGPGTCVAVAVDPSRAPAASLKCSPNPTEGPALLQFEQKGSGRATIEVLDVLGRRIRKVSDEFRAAGTQRVIWEGTDETGSRVPPGLYFWRVLAGGEFRTGRLVVSR